MAGKEKDTELALRDKGALPVKLDIQEGDTDQYNREDPILVFVKIRQKDLKGDGGKTERDAGGFAFSDGRPDLKALHGAVIGSWKGRVFFEKLEDKMPTCKSKDGQAGSRLREGPRYGECATCVLSQFLDGKTPPCREIRNLAFVQVDGDSKPEDAYMLTLSPSGLRPWRAHNNAVLRLARRSAPDIEAAPHHLVLVEVETEYKDEPAPHYIPSFKVDAAANKGLADLLRKERELQAERARQAHERQEFEAEDFLGDEDNNKDRTPF